MIKEYIKRINKFSKLIHVKILYKKIEGIAFFCPNKKIIEINISLKNRTDSIYYLLHELGHVLDDNINPHKNWNRHLNDALTKIEQQKKSTLTRIQKNKIMESEINAWNNAEAIAKMLRIPVGKRFKKIRKSSLSTYKNIKIE